MQHVPGEGADVGLAGDPGEVADQREHREQGQPADCDQQDTAPAEPDPGHRHQQQQEAGHHGERSAHFAAEPGPAGGDHGEDRHGRHCGQRRAPGGGPGRGPGLSPDIGTAPQRDQGQPGGGEQRGDAIDAQRLVADAVEPATLDQGQPERRLQLQPGPGHHVDPEHGHGEQADQAERRERVAPAGDEQGGQRDDGGQRHGHPVQPGRRVGQSPPRHQVGQEGARGHRDGKHRGHAPPPRAPPTAFRRGTPEDQADGGQGRRVGQRIGPEEPVVGGPPDLFGGVPAGQPADGGGQGTARAPGERRADQAGRHVAAQPAEHGRGQVGEHDQAGLAGRAGLEQAALIPNPVDQRQLQVRGPGRRAGRGDELGGASGEFGYQALAVRCPRRRRAEVRSMRSKMAQVHDGQRAAGQDRGRRWRSDTDGR